MLIGLISDVHANVLALEAALAALKRAGATTIVCLGDLVGYGPAPNETIELIRSSNILCTLGEADERIAYGFATRAKRAGVADETIEWTRTVIDADHVTWLRSLPVQRRLDTPAGRLRWFHGSAEDPADRLNLQQDPISLTRMLQRHRCTILSCGGSHVPYFRKVASAGWVINPGSVGLSLNGEPGADYALVRIDGDGVDVRMDKVEYDVAAVAFDIVAWGLPAVIAEAVQRGRMPTRDTDGGRD
ncbi:MAG: metallophosphoesterase [Trueperaceae bacterium]|jgi:putative phosphoesterase|nr:MAG: metallophosphoesterase [Trueperaceae bacterium]